MDNHLPPDNPDATPVKVWQRIGAILRNPLRFVARVLGGFRANQGFLLAGAVAYNTLLSVVPMFALILVVLSQVMDQQELVATMGNYLELIAPEEAAAALTNQIALFLQNWKLVGVVGLVILLFFSSLAFTVLENAMSVIFFHRVAVRRRHFLVSAILPYFYILLLALGLLTVSAVSAGLQAMEARHLAFLGHEVTFDGDSAAVIYLFGVIGEVLLLTSLYMVMPVGRLALRHALIGGVTAALLWEGTRHLLIWYFSRLSFVNLIYGSLATVIIILLSLEIAAMILLLGAQVIAEYERSGTAHEGHTGLQTGPVERD